MAVGPDLSERSEFREGALMGLLRKPVLRKARQRSEGPRKPCADIRAGIAIATSSSYQQQQVVGGITAATSRGVAPWTPGSH
jgi:hypothetical protein